MESLKRFAKGMRVFSAIPQFEIPVQNFLNIFIGGEYNSNQKLEIIQPLIFELTYIILKKLKNE